MQRYILARFGQALISMFFLVTIVFFAARLTGDPVDLMLPSDATVEDYAAVRADLGLDKPLPVQYWVYLKKLAKADLGDSIRARRPVLELVLERLPASLQLITASMLVSLLVAIPIGVHAAVRRDSFFDILFRLVAVAGQSAPIFWVGLILILIFAVHYNLVPSAGSGGIEYLILPAVTLGWYMAAGIMRLMRSSMLEVLRSEYMKLARIKGLTERVVIWKHGVRNAILPVVTLVTLMFIAHISSTVVTESVFAWPGVGRLMIEAVRWRDFPLVQAIILIVSALYIIGNLAADIFYAYLDPRIRYQ